MVVMLLKSEFWCLWTFVVWVLEGFFLQTNLFSFILVHFLNPICLGGDERTIVFQSGVFPSSYSSYELAFD